MHGITNIKCKVISHHSDFVKIDFSSALGLAHSDDGGIKFLWKVGNIERDCTTVLFMHTAVVTLNCHSHCGYGHAQLKVRWPSGTYTERFCGTGGHLLFVYTHSRT